MNKILFFAALLVIINTNAEPIYYCAPRIKCYQNNVPASCIKEEVGIGSFKSGVVSSAFVYTLENAKYFNNETFKEYVCLYSSPKGYIKFGGTNYKADLEAPSPNNWVGNKEAATCLAINFVHCPFTKK